MKETMDAKSIRKIYLGDLTIRVASALREKGVKTQAQFEEEEKAATLLPPTANYKDTLTPTKVILTSTLDEADVMYRLKTSDYVKTDKTVLAFDTIELLIAEIEKDVAKPATETKPDPFDKIKMKKESELEPDEPEIA